MNGLSPVGTAMPCHGTISPVVDGGPRDHSFSTFAEFPKNLIFLTPDTHTYVFVSGGKKYSFSENFANILNE